MDQETDLDQETHLEQWPPLRRLIAPAGLLAGALLLPLTPAPTAAQVEISARSATVRVGGRLHAQMATSSLPDGIATDFFIRRARIELDVTVSDFLDGRVHPDFGGGELSVKDAYFRMKFAPSFNLTVGQFKRAFDLFELTSSSEILVVERDGGIPGLGACEGPGGVCSLSRFSEKLDYSDRDIGLRAEGELGGGRLAYMATLTNGAGANKDEVNDAKSVAGRVEIAATDDVRIAGNFSVHDYEGAVDDEFATAFGADVEVGSYSEGFHLQAGVIIGDNWKKDEEGTGDSPRFATLQAIAAYRKLLPGSTRLASIEPVGRISWGDPDSNVARDGGLLLTPGVNLYVSGRNRIGANLDVYSPQTGDTEWSLKVQTSLYF